MEHYHSLALIGLGVGVVIGGTFSFTGYLIGLVMQLFNRFH